MDEKHHLTPRFLLNRFSDNGRIVMSDRLLRVHIPTSAERAGRIGSYYLLPDTPAVHISLARDALAELGSDPDMRDAILDVRGDRLSLRASSIERFLGYVEARTAPGFDRLVAEGPPGIDRDRATERFWLASFMAVQYVRGEVFRERLNDIMRATIRESISAEPHTRTERWRAACPARTKRKSEKEITAFLVGSLDRLRLSKLAPLGEMLPMAFDQIAPRLFGGVWRVLAYDAPDVVTSDEAVGLWARPTRDLYRYPLAIGTADAIFFPLDAHHTLQILHSDASAPEGRLAGNELKLRHSNEAVASAAYRWIYSHPANAIIDKLQVSRRPRLEREEVSREEWPTGGRSIIRFFQSAGS